MSDQAPRPVVFFLAGHEVSGRLFDGVSDRLSDDFDCVVLDLPGFDGTSTADGVTKDDLVSFVLRRIREHGSTRWLVAGHSGGARVARGVAERTLAGEPGIFGLAGVVLVDAEADALALPALSVSSDADVASSIREFWSDWAGAAPVIPADVCGTIASGRTSSRTRGILARRALADDPNYPPLILNPTQLSTLRSIADRAVPQTGSPLDLAARADAGLADGASDGWRNAALPPDDEAYRAGLDDLADFRSLPAAEQDERLSAIVAGTWSAPGGHLTAEQLNLWFEDCRVDLVRLWLGHPATMARIGFDGFANGGDLVRIQGFIRLGAGQREEWEPSMGSTR